MSAAFRRMATVAAQVLRSPLVVGGKRGEPTLHIPELRCTPIDPLTPELANRLGLEAPFVGWQTFADGATLDVKSGDLLVANSRKYNVRAVGPWEWRRGVYTALVLEDVKGSHAGG